MTITVSSGAAAIRDLVSDAAREGTTLRITGAGTWLDAGRPVRAAATLSTRELSGIVEYVPGDLTLTALAGTTLEEIRMAAAEHNQWLALDPYGTDQGTIGATIATGSAGPLQTAFGRARDLVLGVEVVTGTGAVVRGGGRVVKNVAGFDLTRLVTGSWGTLGVLTEVTVRLHARPDADETIAIPLAPGAGPGIVQAELRRLPFVPCACEVVNEHLTATLLGTPGTTVIVRIAGNREAVRAQRSALAALGDAADADPAVWHALRAVEPPGALVVRLSRLPSEIDRTWAEAAALASRVEGLLLHATPPRGVVRIVARDSEAARAAIAELLGAASDTVRIAERLPDGLWPRPRDSRTAAGEIAARIRRAYDPAGILNPGILDCA